MHVTALKKMLNDIREIHWKIVLMEQTLKTEIGRLEAENARDNDGGVPEDQGHCKDRL